VYWITGDPPFVLGAAQVAVAEFKVAVTLDTVGGAGLVAGVVTEEGVDESDVP